MTHAEMNRRLATMSQAEIQWICELIGMGHETRTVLNETINTRKQINAVIRYCELQLKDGAL